MTRFFILIGAFGAGLSSITPDAKPLIARFEARYRAAHTLQATFLERYIEGGRVVRVEAGVAYFGRPGKMRWEYESPEKNLFLVDGKTAWFYVPADHTVTRIPAKESTDWRTPLALLAGETKISRICAQIQLAPNEKPESPDSAVFSCIIRSARADPSKRISSDVSRRGAETTQSVVFEIAKGTGDLVRIVVRDPGGVAVEFHFSNWRSNMRLTRSFFRFEVPPGVAIVNGELTPGEVGVNR